MTIGHARSGVVVRRSMAAAAALLMLAGQALPAPAVSSRVLARSPEGREVVLLTVGEPARDAMGRGVDERPAIVIIAGAQGHHTIGTRVANALGQRLIDDHAALLADRTVYIIASLNPDAAARFANAGMPKAESGRAPERTDADRDGRFDEDPPNDLNRDGLITLMRVPAPNARYRISPTHLIDADDPRIMRAPSGDEGRIATHAILIEGIDDDNDGRFNEDGWGGSSGGGTDFDMHFPTHWPEHADGCGLYPLRRAEARALVEWLQSRHNIVAGLVYGPHDTISTIPPVGQFGPERRVPKGIEEGDKPVYELVSKKFNEITGITKAEDGPDRAGSLLQWMYADLGVYAFGTPVWVRPDLVKKEKDSASAGNEGEPSAAAAESNTDGAEAPAAAALAAARQAEREALLARGVPTMMIDFLHMAPEERAAQIASFENASEQEQASMMAMVGALPEDVRARVMALAQGGEDPSPPTPAQGTEAAPAGDAQAPARRRGANNADKKKSDSPEAKWLAWLDSSRSGTGFVAWEPFDHPQLGPVEIGGFVPGVRFNPPEELVAGLIDEQSAFAAALLAHLPMLEVSDPVAERLGPGLWRVSIQLRNTGPMPTASAIAGKARRVHPIVLALDPDQSLPREALLSGGRLARFESIPGNGTTERAEWLIAANDAGSITIEVRTGQFGWRRMSVRLEGN